MSCSAMVSGLHSCHENPGAAEPPPSGPHALGSLHHAGLDKLPALTSRRSCRCGQPAGCPLGPGARLRVAHRLVVRRQALGAVAADAAQHCTAHAMAMPDSNGPGQVRAKTVARIWDRGLLRAAVGRCQPDSAMLSATCDGERGRWLTRRSDTRYSRQGRCGLARPLYLAGVAQHAERPSRLRRAELAPTRQGPAKVSEIGTYSARLVRTKRAGQ
jgi:hypothetical protein